MKQKLCKYVVGFFLLLTVALHGQHTFSIVAVDITTGEIGSAGATCLDDNSFPGSGGAVIISDVLPGVGAVHTQASWLAANQNNANRLLNEGKSAVEIIDWVVNNDAQFNSTVRQYGAVTIKDSLSSASFTGVNCFDEKSHRTGSQYSIQGNILLSNGVLDSMESAFLKSAGQPLCTRLMAALQAANIPGADSRCLSEGVSSRSAFLRVARPDDSVDDFWMDLNVPSTGFGVEPIDSLAVLVENFKNTLSTSQEGKAAIRLFPNPTSGEVSLILGDNDYSGGAILHIYDVNGRSIKKLDLENGQNDLNLKLTRGLYIAFIEDSQSGHFRTINKLMIEN